MPTNPPENTPRITPYLLYEDVAGAIGWLTTAFGFRESMRLPGPDGRIAHAEMRLADGLIMMGCPGPRYQNPKRLGQVTQHLYVYVDDVDAHFERARKTGAEDCRRAQRSVLWRPPVRRRRSGRTLLVLRPACSRCVFQGDASIRTAEYLSSPDISPCPQ